MYGVKVACYRRNAALGKHKLAMDGVELLEWNLEKMQYLPCSLLQMCSVSK